MMFGTLPVTYAMGFIELVILFASLGPISTK